jgi:hypothetical protein
MNTKQRKKIMLSMREKGRTFTYIAKIFHISYQRVGQIISPFALTSALRKKEENKIKRLNRKPSSLKMQNYIKNERRKYDGNKCQICWKTGEINTLNPQRKLSIHHIDQNKENNDMDNLITLCSQCHSEVHQNLDKKR